VLTQDALWTELRENEGGAAASFKQPVSIDAKHASALAELIREANGKVTGKPILVLDRPVKGAGVATLYPKVSSVSWRFVR
jgi:hypothetical protein